MVNLLTAGPVEVNTSKGGANVLRLESSGSNSYGLMCKAGGEGAANYYCDFRDQSNNSVFKINGDNSASFAGTVNSTYSPGGSGGYAFALTQPGTNNTAGGLWQKDGGSSALFLKAAWNGAETVALNGSDGTAKFNGVCQFYSAAGAIDGYRHKLGASGYYLSDDSGNTTISLYSDGRIITVGDNSYVHIGIPKDANKVPFNIYDTANGNEMIARIKGDGTAEFANTVTSGSSTDRGQFLGTCPGGVTASLADAFVADYDGTTVARVKYDGSAVFEGDITAGNVTFNIDADNPDSYETSTEEYTETETYTGPRGNELTREVTKTREVKTYVGPTLNVKDELVALRERATQQDAVIAQMTSLLKSLGADVSTLPALEG